MCIRHYCEQRRYPSSNSTIAPRPERRKNIHLGARLDVPTQSLTINCVGAPVYAHIQALPSECARKVCLRGKAPAQVELFVIILPPFKTCLLLFLIVYYEYFFFLLKVNFLIMPINCNILQHNFYCQGLCSRFVVCAN